MIDDKGRLFGVVNIIDAFVVLFMVAVVVAGVAVVSGSSGADAEEERSVTVVVGSEVPAYVSDALADVDADRLANVTVVGEQTNATTGRQYHRVHATVEVEVTERADGRLVADGQRVAVGGSFEVDLGRVVFEGAVREIRDDA